MKKIWLAIGLASLLAAPAAQASIISSGTVVMTDLPPSWPGGPFQAKVTSGLSVLTANPFQTFCIEYTETITLSTAITYAADLNTEAVDGSGGPNPDPVSRATAWLYSQFRAGTLDDVTAYTYNDTGNVSLQQAIWWLEQETDAYTSGTHKAPTGSESAWNNYLVAAAVTATGAGTASNARTIDANGAYGVYALNLYSPTGAKVQDMLAIVPEPTTYLAGALLLLPFGASTLRILRKKNEA
jgi:hypothetical protein